MAKTFRDLPRFYGFVLCAGVASYLGILAVIALMIGGVTAREDALERREQARKAEPRPPDDLRRVPEVTLETFSQNPQVSKQQLTQLVRKIRAQDGADPDAFVKGLIRDRSDLRGLPFQMGGKCRMDAATTGAFGVAVATTHSVLRMEDTALITSVEPAAEFFTRYGSQDTGAGVAALTQIFGPEKQSRRASLAKKLSEIDHPAATRALARTAVFDFDADVRREAIRGLRGRRKAEYTEILVDGLHHPWSQAAHNAGRAIARLERKDLVPQLVAFLAEPDPHAPFDQVIDGQVVTVVREMVKVNHHRNCLLCHSPAPQGSMPGGVMAVTPTPGEPFPSPGEGGNPYGNVPSEVMVRADVTYLRQDFSVREPVANAHPWPEMQRFDFVVRTRPVTADEARAHLDAKKAGDLPLSENHKAALEALRRLTGKDAGTTAAAWVQVLHLPEPQVAKR